MNAGNISKRVALRKKLGCKNFRWYLENILPESVMIAGSEAIGQVGNSIVLNSYSSVLVWIKSFTQVLVKFLYDRFNCLTQNTVWITLVAFEIGKLGFTVVMEMAIRRALAIKKMAKLSIIMIIALALPKKRTSPNQTTMQGKQMIQMPSCQTQTQQIMWCS